MSWILKLFGGSKVALGMGIAMLVLAGSAAAMTKAYFGKRDELAQERVLTSLQEARADQYLADIAKAELRREMLEAARIELQNNITALEQRGVETVTEIREVWRDRNVFIENPVAVECAAVAMPAAVVGLLCEASGVRAGVCADLRSGPDGSDDGLPVAGVDG